MIDVASSNEPAVMETRSGRCADEPNIGEQHCAQKYLVSALPLSAIVVKALVVPLSSPKFAVATGTVTLNALPVNLRQSEQ